MGTVLEVGIRNPFLTPICSSMEECKAKDPQFEMGKLFGVKAKIEPRVNLPINQLTGPDRLWAMISHVRKNYPGVIITYVRVDDDGWVELQMVDSPVAISTIAFAVIVLGILIAAYYVITQLIILTAGGPTSPWWWVMWGVAGLMIVGVASKVVGMVRGKKRG